MKIIFTLFFFTLFLIVINSGVFAAGGTAREGLESAQQGAKQWKADAFLTGISTYNAALDGTASKWTYSFYSAKANMGYMIDIKEGKVVDEMEVRPHIKDSVGVDFMDSPRAMEIAQKNGLKIKGKPVMSLLIMGQATKNPAAYWTIGGHFSPGEVSVILEAKTWRVLKKETY